MRNVYTIRMLRYIFLITVIIIMTSPSFAKEKIILATSQMPPYVASDLKKMGATAHIVRLAFEAVGMEVTFRFYPWSRMLYEVETNNNLDGYFPEHSNEEQKHQLLYSKSIGKSPLGFARRIEHKFHWVTFKDLSPYTIATVRGFVHTKELEELFTEGIVYQDPSVNSLFVLKKVFAGRDNYGVIDCNVFDYFTSADPSFSEYAQKLTVDAHLIDILDLHVCFKNNKRGLFLQRQFNKGLELIRPMQIQRSYIQSLNEKNN